MGKLEQAIGGEDLRYALSDSGPRASGFAEDGGPFERHLRARNAAEACWQTGRWSDALLLYMEAESHLMEAAPLAIRRCAGSRT